MQNNFWIYHKVSSVWFTAKTWNFIYSCRILFSFKQFLFHNFVIYSRKYICFCGGTQFQDLNAQKNLRPAGDYWHLKCRTLKVKLTLFTYTWHAERHSPPPTNVTPTACRLQITKQILLYQQMWLKNVHYMSLAVWPPWSLHIIFLIFSLLAPYTGKEALDLGPWNDLVPHLTKLYSQVRPRLHGACNCYFFVMTWDKHEASLHLFRIHWKQVCSILVMQSWKVTSKFHFSLFLHIYPYASNTNKCEQPQTCCHDMYKT